MYVSTGAILFTSVYCQNKRTIEDHRERLQINTGTSEDEDIEKYFWSGTSEYV